MRSLNKNLPEGGGGGGHRTIAIIMETDEAVLITVFDLSDTLFVNKHGGRKVGWTLVTEGEYVYEYINKKKTYFYLIFSFYCF